MTWATGVVVALIICSCTDNSNGRQTPAGDEPEKVTFETLTLTEGGAEEGGEKAELTGTLTVVDGCLILTNTNQGSDVVPVFPASSIDKENEEIIYRDFDGKTIALTSGSDVSFGGGGSLDLAKLKSQPCNSDYRTFRVQST